MRNQQERVDNLGITQEPKNNKRVVKTSALALLYDVYTTIKQGSQYPVGNIPSDRDDDLALLMSDNQVKIDNLGNVVVSNSGIQTLKKGIAKVYPLTNRGTAKTYTDTLLTQTDNAANALFATIINLGEHWLPKIQIGKISRFLENLFTYKIANKLPLEQKKMLANSSKELLVATLSNVNSKNSVIHISNELSYYHTRLMYELKKVMKTYEKFDLPSQIDYSSGVFLSSVSINDKGVLTYTLKDAFTGSLEYVTSEETELTHHQLLLILGQIV